MNKKGFTLIELLVYISLSAVIFLTVISFIISLIQVSAKDRVISNVVYSGRLIQDRLSDAARHAEGVDVGASTFDTDPGVLVLDMVDVVDDPMTFSLNTDDGIFQINTAGGGEVPLTTGSISVTNLIFTDLTSAEDTGIIQVEFTLQTTADNKAPQYSYEESFQTTLRIPLQ